MELVIASRNVHKVREFKALLKKMTSFDVLSLLDFPSYIPPEEVGSSFQENAVLKAVHAAASLKKHVLADDSGLVVPSLQGAPGVFSARYAGPHATDKENRKKLLHEMSSLQESLRQAYFECVLALASPEGIIKTVRGIVEGTMLTEEKGRHGFGYDSLFLKHDYGKTFAEIDEETKNRISHRRKALDRLLPILEALQLADTTSS